MADSLFHIRSRWDAVVAGGGPAGLSAGFYLARAGRSVLLVERGALGGKARHLRLITGYPGFPEGISGADLVERLERQAVSAGLVVGNDEVLKARPSEAGFRVECRGGTLRARSVVAATGTRFLPLGLPEEAGFYGRGLYHAAFGCKDAFSGKRVGVVGGGEAAVHQALELAALSASVILFVRGGELKAAGHLIRALSGAPNVETRFEATVRRLLGRRRLEGLVWTGPNSAAPRAEGLDALFVLVGQEPRLPELEPEAPGLFTAGDARTGLRRQAAIAAADGISAGMSCDIFLRETRPAPLGDPA